ncbi:Thebaine 6-O-demethylase [Handroanthus impetiginosus]|uniref:Thebaine 6-O-demethylase n=1 Tax=Handroanthus impetiginosus TaxID=429701 RepID=A0A2G9GZ15_9LAMI|nr:Thebaine 6-O-demethylase [Handroanthus impetiginosus]
MEMQPKSTKFGSSLKVPIVQELAKEKLSSVPERYVRHDHHLHLGLSDVSSLPEIPVINMERLLADSDLIESERQLLHNACQEWGFFQVHTSKKLGDT